MNSPSHCRGEKPWNVVFWLWGAFFIAYVTRQSIFSIFPILRKELGFTEVQLGLTGTVFLWAYALGNPFGGWLSDRVSKKHLIVSSVLLWSVCTFTTGLAKSPAGLLAWRAALAVAQSLYIVTAISLITQAHTEYNRSKALSLHGTAQFAGIAFGGWYGGFVAEAMDWRWMLWFASAAGAVYVPLLFHKLPVSKPVTGPCAERGRAESLQVLSIPTYLFLCLSFVVINAMLWMIYAWFPDFLHDKFQMSLAASGWTATIYVQLATIVGILGGAAVADQLVQKSFRGRFYVLLAGLVLACPFFHAVGQASTLWAVKTFALGYGLFKGAFLANFFASVIDIVPERSRGFALGFANMIGSLSGGLAAYLVGFLKSYIQPEALFSLGSGLGAFAAASLVFSVWKFFPIDYRNAHPSATDRMLAIQATPVTD